MNTWKIRKEEFPMTKIFWPNIEEDFSFATGILPDNQSEPGRPTKNAAKAFLAKAYLFQQKYSEAKVLLDEVITSGNISYLTII